MRILLSLFMVAFGWSAASPQTPASLDRDFVSGGDVRMDLSAGEYKISASADEKVHLQWSTSDEASLRKVKAGAEVKGTTATIKVDGPDNRNLKVEIQVPRQSNLLIRFTAGDFTIDGIEGSKDIAGYAGNLTVDVGDAKLYNSVHASVTTGDLDAAAFHVSKGGLFRSFDMTGSGPYTLRVKLKAGDLKLYERKKSPA